MYEKCLGQHTMKHLPHCNTSKTSHQVGWTPTIIIVFVNVVDHFGTKKKYFVWIAMLHVSDDQVPAYKAEYCDILLFYNKF